MEDTGESLDVDGFDYFDKELPEIDSLMEYSFFDFGDKEKDDDSFL